MSKHQLESKLETAQWKSKWLIQLGWHEGCSIKRARLTEETGWGLLNGHQSWLIQLCWHYSPSMNTWEHMRAQESMSIMNGRNTYKKGCFLLVRELYWRHNKQHQKKEDQQEEEKEGPRSPDHWETERKDTRTQSVSNLQQQADIRHNK